MSKIPKPTGLQYLKENVKDEVDFLPKNKDERFFQIDTIIVGMCSQPCPKISQSNKFAISLQYLKEERNDVAFLHVAWKFDRNWCYDFDGVGQVFSKYPGKQFATSLQYLQKKVRDEADFLHADKHQLFGISFLTEMTRHVQNTQNMQFVMFWRQYLVKKIYLVYFLHAGERENILQRFRFIWPDLVEAFVIFPNGRKNNRLERMIKNN